ncbi:MAG: hypothetical protein ACLQG3_15070 [Terracidiphilus sp.]
MRRTIALTQLALFSLMLIAPFFGPDAEASLPPCCRRNGKHHCMMMEQWLNGAGDKRAHVSDRCTCRPTGGGALTCCLFTPAAEGRPATASAQPATLAERIEARRQQAFFDDHPKRGPPIPLA